MEAIALTLVDHLMHGRVDEVRKILKTNPTCKIDLGDTICLSPLHYACWGGHPEMVQMLLQTKGINPMARSAFLSTPLHAACQSGEVEVVKLLLDDKRVDPLATNNLGVTPLQLALSWEKDEASKWMLASYRDCGCLLITSPTMEGWRNRLARVFRNDPVNTKLRLRRELGLWREDAAFIFVTIIGLCDGYLEFGNLKRGLARRFFLITSQLPMELQMVVCCRVLGSRRDSIPAKWVEMVWHRVLTF